jgi:uncharacterized membrane protein YphA (DoxX/SURF4 family)
MGRVARVRVLARSEWVARAIAIGRIAVGLYFGYEAISKVRQGWLTTGGAAFARSVNGYQGAHGSGPYHDFVTGVILPNAALFAVLVTLGEAFVAISLTLGFLTRAGALAGLWLNLNFLFLRGFTNPSGTLDKVFVLAEILFILTAAGRVWGVDGVIRDRLGRVPVLAWFAGAPADATGRAGYSAH